MGSTDLALYVIATNPLEYLSTFIANIQHLAFPKLVLSNESKWNKKLFKISATLALTLSVTIACYWLAAPMIYKIFFPQYQASVFLSRIYSISLITIVGIVPSIMLQANKKIKRLYAFNTTNSVVSLIILLISLKFGLVGITIGRVIARFCALLITYIATINISQLKPFSK